MNSPSAIAEAAPAPAPMSASDKAAAFEQFLDPEDEDQDDNDTDPDGDEGELEGADLELEDEEAGEADDEPETAIDAPISLNAEEKKAFAAASPEAQQAWAAAETRRNAQVQEATTKASEAQRTADARAAAADAQAQVVYAQQLNEFVKAFEPAAPDTRLAYENPALYIAEKAQYDAAKAQHDDLVQQVRGMAQNAAQTVDQTFLQQRDQELMGIPQVANPETRAEYLEGIFALADEVGFGREQIVGQATAAEVAALGKISERLKAAEGKAAKYDQAMASKMQRVRQGKQRSNRPNAAPQDSRAAQGNRDWQRVKSATSKEAKAEAFADYFGL